MQYNEAVIKSLYDNLETLKSELYRTHGKGAKIMSQFLVDANTNDGLKLVGSIDLIVVDEEGQPLSMSTVQTYLSPNRTDKDPNSDVSVKF